MDSFRPGDVLLGSGYVITGEASWREAAGMRQRGYDEEFTGLRSARSSDLRRTAYLLAGDSHRAEDLVQVPLTKLDVAWPPVHGRGSVEGLRQVDESQVTRGAVTGVVPVRQGPRPSYAGRGLLFAGGRGKPGGVLTGTAVVGVFQSRRLHASSAKTPRLNGEDCTSQRKCRACPACRLCSARWLT